MDREALSTMYECAGSMRVLAEQLSVCYLTLARMLRKYDIPVKHRGFRAPKTVRHYGTDHHNWKGGNWMHSAGYVYEYAPDHPAASGGYVLRHRLVMERSIGRYLSDKETIHHINGDKMDNRAENLQVIAHSIHMKLHKAQAPRDSHGRFTTKEGSTTIIGAAR